MTDTDYFGGSLLDLAMARRVSDIPLLRKDFIVDFYQLAEAVAYGADAVLLIAAALSPAQCRELADAAHGLGLEILLEIHREEELEYVSPEMDMVGINNRNLTTFETDIYTSFRLASQVPVACLKVAESGIRAMETVVGLRRLGFRGFLIGEHFMREAQPAQALKNFVGYAD